MIRKFATLIFLTIALAIFSFSCQKLRPTSRGNTSPALPVEDSDVSLLPSRPPGNRSPVIWLGLDGLDWDFMDRLSQEGKVPNWTKLVAEGHGANLRSFMPILSPVVWTTIDTGVSPDIHRVLDFQQMNPQLGFKEPISGNARAVPAVWNVASAHGVRVGVVGFWATHPAEIVNGFFISDHATPILFPPSSQESGVAYPASLDAGISQIVARDGHPAAADLVPFFDGVSEGEISMALSSGAGMENPIVAMARILGSTRATQRIARELYDQNHPDLMMVYFEGTDEIGHIFAPDAPPKLACTSDNDYARYHDTAERYFRAMDKILGQWMRRAKAAGATLLVNSDHGFKWGADRFCTRSSSEWSTAAAWHRMNGVFAAWGAGVKPTPRRADASVFDMTPTVLALLHLPVDQRMTGHPIFDAFDNLPRPEREDLFDRIAVRRVSAQAVTKEAAGEYAKKLKALGYLSGAEAQPSSSGAPASGNHYRPDLTEGAWNNLGVYEEETARDMPAAEKAFQEALSIAPDYHSPMFNLAVVYRDEGHDALALGWLFKSFKAGHADPGGTILNWAGYYEEKNNRVAELRLLQRASAAYPQSEEIAVALGNALFLEHDCADAYRAIEPFDTSTQSTQTLNELALLETCLGHHARAVAALERSLKLNPNQPGVVRSLSILRGPAPPGNLPD